MYSLVKELSIQTLAYRELPYLFVSLLIAEAFYKWHSFTLELVGFLATWMVISYIGNTAVDFIKNGQTHNKGART